MKRDPDPSLIPTYVLGLSGEYFVAAELSRWGYQASITYGAAKRVDIQAVNPRNRKLLWIETKTTQRYREQRTTKTRLIEENAQWPVKIREPRSESEANEPSEDFYVFVLVRPKTNVPPRYFVCTLDEVHAAFRQNRDEYNARRHARDKGDYEAEGVPNVRLKHIIQHEGQWQKIVDCLEEE